MANRVKSVSKYSGSAWGTEVPIGADATNVDMTTAPSDYDSSSSETSKVLIGTNDVKVIASDTDLTAWGKFNRFRRRVSNKFADYFATANLTGSSTGVTSSGDDSHAYTTAALNNYFNTVIGYQSAADVSTVGSVASQLSSLNDKSTLHDGEIEELGNNISTMFTINIQGLTFNVGPGTTNWSHKNVSIDGYQTIGIIGYNGASVNCFNYNYYIESDDLVIHAKNITNVTQTGGGNFYILYKKEF